MEGGSKIQKLFPGQKGITVLLEDLPGSVHLFRFKEEDGAIVEDKAGAVDQVDVGLGEEGRNPVEAAGLIGNLYGQDVYHRTGQMMSAKFFVCQSGIIDQKTNNAVAVDAGDPDPVDIDSGLGEDTGAAA